MASVNFPCSLPGILLASFGISEDPHFRSNPVQSGPPINELLSDFTSAPVTVEWSFSAIEYQTFDAWFKYQINFGTTPFNIDIPVGVGLVEHEAQFSGIVSKSKNGKRNHVRATLIAKELVYQEECSALDLLALMTMTNERYQCAFFNNFVNFAENTLPDAWENIKYGTDFS